MDRFAIDVTCTEQNNITIIDCQIIKQCYGAERMPSFFFTCELKDSSCSKITQDSDSGTGGQGNANHINYVIE